MSIDAKRESLSKNFVKANQKRLDAMMCLTKYAAKQNMSSAKHAMQTPASKNIA